ncbi:MAG: CNP1-like family protein [Candidatus Accumulibacter sp.]|jgi:hypothetical protein|nr:CNP1-like family protein [Accumulibacter sp.]
MKDMAVARRLVVFVISGLLLSVFPKTVFPALSDNEFDEKPWQEIEVQLPPFPQSENLIPFKVGSISDKQFLVDEKSISIGSDEVIRYSLVVISSSGARSISYEGMRCATAERRSYAFGQANKTWSKARSNKWIGIRGGSNSHYVALFADYFCAIGQPAIMKPEDAVRVLRYGIQNTGT